MKNLKDYSDFELSDELKRRKEELEKVKLIKPDVKPLTIVDYTSLAGRIDSTLKQAIEDKYWDDDNDHYILEDVMETVYGKDFYKWFNEAGLV